MKLVIGSAQLGMSYGLFNKKKISIKEFKKIEKLVLNSNINFIDTATSYGDSEIIIGNSDLKNLNIITKTKLPKNKNIDIKNWLSKEIIRSLKRLKVKKIYGVLIHDYKDILGKRGKAYLLSLQQLKKKKIVDKIGISIYDPKELKKIWKFWKPDLVQAPLNPIDNRILNSNWLNVLKKNRIKIYARSIFLQGILINDYSSLGINKKYKLILDKLKNWCYKNNISMLRACIDFVRQFKEIDYLVVGFNNYNQLKEIISAFKKKKINVPKIFYSNKKKLIDPREWN
jgi:aryl-alcohol dehydrogenase-like predicted oxidoreductase